MSWEITTPARASCSPATGRRRRWNIRVSAASSPTTPVSARRCHRMWRSQTTGRRRFERGPRRLSAGRLLRFQRRATIPRAWRDLQLPEGVSFARSEHRREMLAQNGCASRDKWKKARPRTTATPFTNKPIGCSPRPRQRPPLTFRARKAQTRERYGNAPHRHRLPAGAAARRSRLALRYGRGYRLGHASTDFQASCPTRAFPAAANSRASTAPTPRCSPTCASAACSIPRSS